MTFPQEVNFSHEVKISRKGEFFHEVKVPHEVNFPHEVEISREGGFFYEIEIPFRLIFFHKEKIIHMGVRVFMRWNSFTG